MRIAYINSREVVLDTHVELERSGVVQGAEKYLQTLIQGVISQGHETEIFYSIGRESPNRVSGAWPVVVNRTADWSHLRNWQPDLIHLVNPAHIGLFVLDFAKAHDIPVVTTVVDHWWLCPKATMITSSNERCKGEKPSAECSLCIARSHRSSAWQKLAKKVPDDIAELAQRIVIYNRLQWRTSDWVDRTATIKEYANRVHSWITLSRETERLIQQWHFSPAFIPVGLSDAWFKDQPKSVRPRSQGKLRLGYCGLLARHKGVDVLLEALNKLNGENISLAIAGEATDTQYRDELAGLAAKCEVTFLGALSVPELKAFYRSIDLLIVPSRAPENRPQVIAEAASQMVPVLGSDSPGIAEMLTHECVFNVGDVDALAELLSNVLEGTLNPSLPKPTGSSDEMVAKTLALYEQAVA